jgi:hypothetical protein
MSLVTKQGDFRRPKVNGPIGRGSGDIPSSPRAPAPRSPDTAARRLSCFEGLPFQEELDAHGRPLPRPRVGINESEPKCQKYKRRRSPELSPSVESLKFFLIIILEMNIAKRFFSLDLFSHANLIGVTMGADA